jgi:hypothetical protein
MMKLFESRWWYPAIGLVVALVLLAVILSVGSCGRRSAPQIAQSAAGAQAANAAGAAAVQTASSVAAAEASSDEATRLTVKEIDNAQNPDDVRRAVLDRLCKQPSHRLDAACRVR